MVFLEALQLFYWFLPGYVANACPPVLAKLSLLERWNAPLDAGRRWRRKRLLGAHKTWRGLLGGVLLGGVVFILQQQLFTRFITTPFIPYDSFPWWYGFLFALGTLLVGDAGESFFKRRVGVKPGNHWIPWDQVDYTLGAFLVVGWFWWPGIQAFLFLLVANGLLSASSHFLAGSVGLTRERL